MATSVAAVIAFVLARSEPPRQYDPNQCLNITSYQQCELLSFCRWEQSSCAIDYSACSRIDAFDSQTCDYTPQCITCMTGNPHGPSEVRCSGYDPSKPPGQGCHRKPVIPTYNPNACPNVTSYQKCQSLDYCVWDSLHDKCAIDYSVCRQMTSISDRFKCDFTPQCIWCMTAMPHRPAEARCSPFTTGPPNNFTACDRKPNPPPPVPTENVLANWTYCNTGLCDHNGSVCCPATCGKCGGDQCDKRPGGVTKCCTGGIKRTKKICESPTEVACEVPSGPWGPYQCVGRPNHNITTTTTSSRLILHVAPPSSAEQQPTQSHQRDGSAAAPFLTVTHARDRIRALQPVHGATVVLHAGVHQPFTLDGHLDLGRPGHPIVYAGGDGATISGSVSIPPSAFQKWSGGAAGTYMADLGALGITTAMLGGMQYPGSMSFGSCQHDKAGLFYGGEAMTLARYPNIAADGSWKFLYADKAGKFGRASKTDGGAWFLMKVGPNASRIAGWAARDSAAWLHGYWQFDWADSYRRLEGVRPVSVKGTQFLNVSFYPDTGNVSAGLQVCVRVYYVYV